MNEHVARDVVLVWAIENSDYDRQILTDDDRMYASRTANELAKWDAADKNEATSPDLFLQRRAEQIVKKIAERTPAFSKVIARRNWLPVLSVGLPVVALLFGILVDRIADPHRVDLLSAPLLLILFWNLLVYAALLFSLVVPASKTRRIHAGWLPRLTTGVISSQRKLPQALGTAMLRFGDEWVKLSLPLTTARAKRIFHLSAACFALGVILSLYMRGILYQYRAGWESTLLNAEQVHTLLSVLFAPAVSLFHLQGFSVADVKSLQFSQPALPASGAIWLHLYASTLFLFVVTPRIMLALAAGWKEKKLARHFPIDLGQPYYRKVIGKMGATAPAVLRVFPYSFTIDEMRDRNLTTVAQMLLGDHARVMLRPSTAYGEEPPPLDATQDNAGIALTVALFNLSATPEKENHDAFVDHLLRGSARGILALIDESAYLERIGIQAGGESRVEERIALWRQFCGRHNVPAAVVNLIDPHKRAGEMERGLASLVRS